ncbi:MAG: hypothetical protein M1831_003421 [Alyxoria varia]|nr:MAG: hypothetical protein M1831_003421 [Alyxoria varia]
MHTRSQRQLEGRTINDVALTSFEYERQRQPQRSPTSSRRQPTTAGSINRHLRDDISQMSTLAELRRKAESEGLPRPKHGKFTVRRRELRRAIRDRQKADRERAERASAETGRVLEVQRQKEEEMELGRMDERNVIHVHKRHDDKEKSEMRAHFEQKQRQAKEEVKAREDAAGENAPRTPLSGKRKSREEDTTEQHEQPQPKKQRSTAEPGLDPKKNKYARGTLEQECRKRHLWTYGTDRQLRKRLLNYPHRGFPWVSSMEEGKNENPHLANACDKLGVKNRANKPNAQVAKELFDNVSKPQKTSNMTLRDWQKLLAFRRLDTETTDADNPTDLQRRLYTYERRANAESSPLDEEDDTSEEDLGSYGSDAGFSEKSDFGNNEKGTVAAYRDGVLNKSRAAADEPVLNSSTLTIEADSDACDFRQYNVEGDGSCFWRAFSKAYFGTQNRWEEVKARSARLFFKVMEQDGSTEARLRRNLYTEMNPLCALDDGTWGHRLEAELTKRDYWASTDSVQVAADAYGVRFCILCPEYWANRELDPGEPFDDPEAWELDPTPHWGLQFRGQPWHRDLYVANYRRGGGAAHWTALEPLEGQEFTPNLNDYDVIMRSCPGEDINIPEALTEWVHEN